ncbi:helix-turn-helix domain-containing protein [Inquilinus sp. KBS0705]|nr:helix-turn-helix domain-containing protein [Inquilinus sp. KBS0705]
MATVEILTREDLQQFREQLLEDIQNILSIRPTQVKKWLKSAEVRKMLNISPSTLQSLRINGILNFTRIGSIMYYKNDDITKLLEGKD